LKFLKLLFSESSAWRWSNISGHQVVWTRQRGQFLRRFGPTFGRGCLLQRTRPLPVHDSATTMHTRHMQ